MAENGDTGTAAPKRASRSTRDGSRSGAARDTGSGQGTTSGRARRDVGARGILAAAQELATELGWGAESLSGLRREGEGWTVTMDVVETRRVPSTTDVIAVYDVDLDDAGELLGYRRLRHYVRGRGDNERYG
ncbi:gas vesicle protein GvpO [Actinomycetospora straminea]|uniref:Gas vesicle protein GvpO n=1 Tax=Actinomycetospora straminea TaxID=663607 RepID=A0ABP9EFZ2_9PSEU|nr:gas vesicle protein GvpO [Actinomycetospora straminea]MDD7935697.1 gas vesicle protein [Actinomycetospora straminea]